MLRLQFSASDLARVRLRGTLGPLPETLLALRALRSARDAGPLADWRRRVLSRLPPAAAVARLLPPGWTAADVFALVGPAGTVEQGLAALRRRRRRRTPPAGRSLLPARDSTPERLDPAAVLAVSYDLGVSPHWPAMRAHLDAERATRARILADGGIDGLFATLHPALRWRPPVLELPIGPGRSPASWSACSPGAAWTSSRRSSAATCPEASPAGRRRSRRVDLSGPARPCCRPAARRAAPTATCPTGWPVWSGRPGRPSSPR